MDDPGHDPDEHAPASRRRSVSGRVRGRGPAGSPPAHRGSSGELEPAFGGLGSEPTSGNVPRSRPTVDEPRDVPRQDRAGDPDRGAGTLEAQLQLARREAARGVERLLGAISHLHDRLASLEHDTKLDERLRATEEAVLERLDTAQASVLDRLELMEAKVGDLVAFRDELFSWLGEYAQWQLGQLERLQDTIVLGEPSSRGAEPDRP